eukprot:7948422-Ditylum_brightwellii.AAC.1
MGTTVLSRLTYVGVIKSHVFMGYNNLELKNALITLQWCPFNIQYLWEEKRIHASVMPHAFQEAEDLFLYSHALNSRGKPT